MIWLYNNNYKFRNSLSDKRFQDICNANQNLRITDKLYVFEEDKLPPKDQIYEKRHDSYSVTFEKNFTPSSIEVGEARNVRSKTTDLLSGN